MGWEILHAERFKPIRWTKPEYKVEYYLCLTVRKEVRRDA